MPVAWKIIATTARVGGKPNLPPQHEYFLAAFPDQAVALKALCAKRPDLNGAQFEVKGEADRWFIDWLDVKDGQILSIMVVQ
jgi:hypothetical protein